LIIGIEELLACPLTLNEGAFLRLIRHLSDAIYLHAPVNSGSSPARPGRHGRNARRMFFHIESKQNVWTVFRQTRAHSVCHTDCCGGDCAAGGFQYNLTGTGVGSEE
jgi:hypothetical protein